MTTRFATAVALGFAAALVTTPSFARSTLAVTEKAEFAASPAKTWEAIRDYGGLPGWHPAFAGDEIVKGKNNAKGAVRVLTLKDGGKITEELLSHSDKAMTMTYRITASPLPITAYRSTIKVTPGANGGSVVSWSGTFKGKDAKPQEGATDDASLKKLISGVYTAGLGNLPAVLGK